MFKPSALSTLAISLFSLSISTYAATPLNLRHQPAGMLQILSAARERSVDKTATNWQEISRDVDFNGTIHVRMQQTYAGLPVWGAQAIKHISRVTSSSASKMISNQPQTTLSGVVYTDLAKDLTSTALTVSEQQKTQALAVFKGMYANQKNNRLFVAQKESAEPIIFVDQQNIAHLALLTSFYFDDGKTGAHQPTAIIDAASFKIYRVWDRVMTFEMPPEGTEPVQAGGIGGSEKEGDIAYDGDHTLNMSLFTENIIYQGQQYQIPYCFLMNDDTTVVDVSYDRVAYSVCYPDAAHHNIHWLTSYRSSYWTEDAFNGARSPSLDALASAKVVKSLYEDWYKVPVLKDKDGKSMRLLMRVHYGRGYDNAYWDGEKMTFGDGDNDTFYPFVSLSVAAHEISHGFSTQHAQLDSSWPALGLNEAFSDMAAKAAELYTTGSNTWSLGAELYKQAGQALRYMDDPKKDGASYDNARDFHDPDNGGDPTSFDVDPHLIAGIYNKAFYLIATAPGWDTRKAFNVMVQANMHYWTPATTFTEVACGVISATNDYHYDVQTVKSAFSRVGIETNNC